MVYVIVFMSDYKWRWQALCLPVARFEASISLLSLLCNWLSQVSEAFDDDLCQFACYDSSHGLSAKYKWDLRGEEAEADLGLVSY